MANMRRRSKRSVDRVNLQLQDAELELLKGSSIDWDVLRPQVEDSETYDKLIVEVQAATAANESLAALKSRLEQLGTQGAAVIQKVIDLAT
jgi:hypothetical protein